MKSLLVGGFNPSDKYESNWIISPCRDDVFCSKMKPPTVPSPETNISPENVGPLEIRRFLLKTTIFRNYLENVPYIPSPSLFGTLTNSAWSCFSNRGGGTTLLRSRRWMFGPMEMDVQVNQGSLLPSQTSCIVTKVIFGTSLKNVHIGKMLLGGPFLQQYPPGIPVPYPHPDFP